RHSTSASREIYRPTLLPTRPTCRDAWDARGPTLLDRLEDLAARYTELQGGIPLTTNGPAGQEDEIQYELSSKDQFRITWDRHSDTYTISITAHPEDPQNPPSNPTQNTSHSTTPSTGRTGEDPQTTPLRPGRTKASPRRTSTTQKKHNGHTISWRLS
ncbi:MAG: hypothetical protein HC945_03670, partial [Nitrosarchaeum sp.]|nr:hypothetical protein [Nitrosarchaeum sp.]